MGTSAACVVYAKIDSIAKHVQLQMTRGKIFHFIERDFKGYSPPIQLAFEFSATFRFRRLAVRNSNHAPNESCVRPYFSEWPDSLHHPLATQIRGNLGILPSTNRSETLHGEYLDWVICPLNPRVCKTIPPRQQIFSTVIRLNDR